MFDYHVHTQYSDGDNLHTYESAVDELDLDGIGFADHALYTTDPNLREFRTWLGHVFDKIYPERREALERFEKETGVTTYDGVELDYFSWQEDELRQFLADAGFDYVVGSIHYYKDNANLMHNAYFESLSDTELDTVVEEYFNELVSLIDSGLADIVAHPDLFERNPYLRGRATTEQYKRVAEALKDSDAVPEINAGRVHRDLGQLHPVEPFRRVLDEYNIDFVFSTDAHTSDQLVSRRETIQNTDLDVGRTTLDL